MSQSIFDTIVPTTTSGNQLAGILSDFKNAIVSGFSGTSRPSQLQAGGYWIDTLNDATGIWVFKIFDGVQDFTVFTLNKNTGLASISSADSLFQVARTSEDSVGPILRLLKARVSGNNQTKTGDTLGEVQFDGKRDDGATVLQARVKSLSNNDVTATQQGAALVFEVTATNGAAISEVMRVTDGRVGIGTIAPQNALHVVGSGSRFEKISDDAVGMRLLVKKKRIANLGKVLSGDVIGETEYISTDDTGAEVPAMKVEVAARENHTTGAHGSKATFKTKKLGQTVYTDQLVLDDVVNVKTDLVVEGSLTVKGTVTTVNTNNLDIKDANISVNIGGNQATANANKAGIKVEMSDATHAELSYDSSKASKWVAGNVGSESEIITATHTQTLQNKTLTSPTINNPAKSEVKLDTEANLTTYAASVNGTNGQWCFATDTKVMYQVLDGSLVPAGAGGGGSSLVWEKSGAISPITEYVDGIHLEGFGKDDTQEMYCFITIPSSYRTGKPIKLSNGAFFLNQIAGNVRFRTETTLVRMDSTVLGTYPDKYTSTNVQAVAPAVANTLKAIGDLDLTNTTGQINGKAVAKGDILRVRIYRDFASETTPATQDAKLLINNFELRLS